MKYLRVSGESSQAPHRESNTPGLGNCPVWMTTSASRFEAKRHPAYNLGMQVEMLSVNEVSRAAIRPDRFDELADGLNLLGFSGNHPAIVIVGGAGGMTPEDIEKVQAFFELRLVPFADSKDAVIIDGGTDSGVMAAIGRAVKHAGGHVPVVGVVAREIELVDTFLEPNHSHFILCPGTRWGDESEWIAAAAKAVSGLLARVTIMINGGQIAWEDARVNIEYGSPVVIAEGSGRTADVIAETSIGMKFEPRALSLIRTGKIHIANFFKDPDGFMKKMDELMK